MNFYSIFICNPSNMHTSYYMQKKKSNIFIEKPLSNSLDNVEKFKRIVKYNKINCAVGFHTHRYHPFLKKIKSIIQNNNLGKIEKIYKKFKLSTLPS